MSNAEPASPAADLSWRPTYDPSQSELNFFLHDKQGSTMNMMQTAHLNATIEVELPVRSQIRAPFSFPLAHIKSVISIFEVF